MTLNCLPNDNAYDLRVDVGVSPATLAPLLTQADIPAGTVFEDTLGGLQTDTKYYYRIMYRAAHNEVYYRVWHADSLGLDSGIYGFHTARDTTSQFVFTIDSDSHRGGKGVPPDGHNLYHLMQINVAEDNPDFHFTLGDHVALDGIDTTYAMAIATNQEMRQEMDSTRVPFFYVLGNHEREEGWLTDSVKVSAANARLALWPNPQVGGFYSGDTTQTACCGRRESYYSFEWGSALFVALDPFWYTDSSAIFTHDRWNWTLGLDQYNWLYNTLSGSSATWKFVFIHHLTGGSTEYGRGGIEAVKHSVADSATFEWGGENLAGANVYAAYRPGWSHGPIHDMLDTADVDIVFKGHDHGYVYQALDGIVYQTVAHHGCTKQCYEAGFTLTYADSNSTKLNNPGYERITVFGQDSVRVEYVRTVWDGVEPLVEGADSVYNRDVSHSYTLYP